MNKRISIHAFIILFMSALASCMKDTGNYTYHQVSQVIFKNFDTTAGYEAFVGKMLAIQPVIETTIPQTPANAGYSYEWSLFMPVPTGGGKDSVISTSKDLNVPITLRPGGYSLQYRITDNGTGVRFQKRTTLKVSTEVFEGYMVLNEVNGQSRLDMLSYSLSADKFTQITDVIKYMGSTVPMQGKPYQVQSQAYTRSNITPDFYGIFLLNAAGTNRIHQETFGYEQAFNIRYLMLGDVPGNFTAERLTGEVTANGISIFFVMYANNNMYTYSTSAGYTFKYEPINVYATGTTPFKVAPWAVTNGTVAVMYNMDKKNFVQLASYSNPIVVDMPVSYNFPTGMDLVFMGKDYNNKLYAVLKDPATAKYYFLRSLFSKAWDYYDEVVAPDFANATNFALSPDRGYLFYSVGGKVYEYDLSLKTSYLMVDKGAQQISHMAFQRFYYPASAVNPNYKTWQNLLTVASYDPAGTPGSNGTMELYSVPDVHGQIVKTNSWTGFGKIVSVSYRERF